VNVNFSPKVPQRTKTIMGHSLVELEIMPKFLFLSPQVLAHREEREREREREARENLSQCPQHECAQMDWSQK